MLSQTHLFTLIKEFKIDLDRQDLPEVVRKYLGKLQMKILIAIKRVVDYNFSVRVELADTVVDLASIRIGKKPEVNHWVAASASSRSGMRGGNR